MDNGQISAMAFDIAKRIEEEINLRSDNIKEKNKMLEAKILGFRTIIKGWPGFLEQYDEYFEIQKMRRGNAE